MSEAQQTEPVVATEATSANVPDPAKITAEGTSPSELLEARAEILTRQGNIRRFEVKTKSAFGDDPKGEEKARYGIALWIMGRFAAAEPVLSESDGTTLSRFALADLHTRFDRVDKALALLEELVKSQPNDLLIHRMIAECLERMGRMDDFLEAVEKYLSKDPESATAHYLMGLRAEDEGEYDEAQERYSTAVMIDPHCDAAKFRLARHHYLRGEEDRAVELYEELAERQPASASALINLGVIYEDQEDFDLAEEVYHKVLEFYPDHERAQMYLRDAVESQDMYYDEEKERKEDKKAQILRIPVTDFELSVRSRNCLAKMNIKTLGDLVTRTEAELLAFKNFGETSLAEIKDILRQKGLRLGIAADAKPRPEPRPRVDPDSVMAKSIADLDLSVRSRKACEYLKILSVGELVNRSEAEFMSCKNFGQTSLNELKKKLTDLGLSLKS